MSRYINADSLKVSITKYGALRISHKKLPIVKNEVKELIGDICFAIDAKSTEDVVPVVRCKDCRYWDERTTNKKGFVVCSATHMDCTEDDYCSFGEKVKE